jgi:hypothetical protein
MAIPHVDTCKALTRMPHACAVPCRQRSRAAKALFIVILGILSALSGERDAFAQSSSMEEREKKATEHFQKGLDLINVNDISGAYREFNEAWKHKQSYDIAGNLGLTELKLGMKREAANHFAYCEQNFPLTNVEGRSSRLDAVRQQFGKARAQVGGARVRVTADDGGQVVGADVAVDGTLVGTVYSGNMVVQPFGVRGEVFVDPGRRRFSASLQGCEDASAEVNVSKGGSEDVELVLSCREKLSVPAMAMGFGLTAVGLGVGIGSAVLAANSDGKAGALWGELYRKDGRSACILPSNATKCDELDRAIADSLVFAQWKTVSLIFAGLAFAGTAAYVISVKASPRVQTAFSVGPGGGGAIVRGIF